MGCGRSKPLRGSASLTGLVLFLGACAAEVSSTPVSQVADGFRVAEGFSVSVTGDAATAAGHESLDQAVRYALMISDMGPFVWPADGGAYRVVLQVLDQRRVSGWQRQMFGALAGRARATVLVQLVDRETDRVLRQQRLEVASSTGSVYAGGSAEVAQLIAARVVHLLDMWRNEQTMAGSN